MQKWMLIQNNEIIIGQNELLHDWDKTADGILWIDIEGSADQLDKEVLIEQFNLPVDDVSDALKDRHPPGFNGEANYLFLLLKMLDSESHTLDFNTQQMGIFSGENYVITRHNKPSNFINSIWQNAINNILIIDSPLKIVSLVTRRMVFRYGQILLNLEERLDTLEDELLTDLNENYMQELLGYNTSLRKMRRILKYHVSVTDQLTRYAKKNQLTNWIDDYEDISCEAERFNSLAELYQNVINDLIEGYISLNSHRLNQVMRVLTVVTVVFLPLSLLVGIYGMNFEYMPELKSRNGYFFLLGFMAFLSTTLAFIFRRIKWL